MDKLAYNDLEQFKTMQDHLQFLKDNVNSYVAKHGYKDDKLMRYVSSIRNRPEEPSHDLEFYTQERQIHDLEEQVDVEEQMLRAAKSKSPSRQGSSQKDITNLNKEIEYLQSKLEEQKHEMFAVDVKLLFLKLKYIG